MVHSIKQFVPLFIAQRTIDLIFIRLSYWINRNIGIIITLLALAALITYFYVKRKKKKAEEELEKSK